jgi:hypothetical protein
MQTGAKYLGNNFDIFLHSMALIIVSGARQKNVRQKNKECLCFLHFSVSHFSVWLVSAPEMTTESQSINSNFLKHHMGGARLCSRGNPTYLRAPLPSIHRTKFERRLYDEAFTSLVAHVARLRSRAFKRNRLCAKQK